MKNILFTIIVVLIGGIVGTFIATNKSVKNKNEIIISKTDSINILKDSINNLNNNIKVIEENNKLLKDTILCFRQNYNPIEEENIVNKYKLERIRYYTNIAKRGNNIKFLRGWIYRVLNK